MVQGTEGNLMRLLTRSRSSTCPDALQSPPAQRVDVLTPRPQIPGIMDLNVLFHSPRPLGRVFWR